MFYREYPPPQNLHGRIQCFWILEHDYREAFHTHEHLWADTHTELIFSYGQPYYRKTASGRVDLPATFIIGPQKKKLLLYSDGFTGFIAARFHPWGFSGFSGSDAASLADNLLPATTAMGQGVITLEDSLRDRTKEEKLSLLTDHFVRAPLRESAVRGIAEAIQAKNGVIKIKALQDSFHISSRKLERLFNEEIGMTAKMFARILRFNYAKRLIELDPDISLSRLTYEAGYADQAHFSNNFKELFDYTPAAFKSVTRQFREKSAGHEINVEFLQDR